MKAMRDWLGKLCNGALKVLLVPQRTFQRKVLERDIFIV